MHAARCAEAFQECFHQIADVKINKQQDALAILLADGGHPEGYTCIIKPLRDPFQPPTPPSPHSTADTTASATPDPTPVQADRATDPGGIGRDAALAATLPSAPEALGAVHCVEWMRDGRSLVYSRVNAEGHPLDAYLHVLGTEQAMDRVLYDEARPSYPQASLSCRPCQLCR